MHLKNDDNCSIVLGIEWSRGTSSTHQSIIKFRFGHIFANSLYRWQFFICDFSLNVFIIVIWFMLISMANGRTIHPFKWWLLLWMNESKWIKKIFECHQRYIQRFYMFGAVYNRLNTLRSFGLWRTKYNLLIQTLINR